MLEDSNWAAGCAVEAIISELAGGADSVPTEIVEGGWRFVFADNETGGVHVVIGLVCKFVCHGDADPFNCWGRDTDDEEMFELLTDTEFAEYGKRVSSKTTCRET